MEGHFKARVCFNPEKKPVMHNENTKKSQVCVTCWSSWFWICFNIIRPHICLLSSEVESELGKLFSKGGKWKNQAKQSGNSTKFQILVEDISEGVLVSSMYSLHKNNISPREEVNWVFSCRLHESPSIILSSFKRILNYFSDWSIWLLEMHNFLV